MNKNPLKKLLRQKVPWRMGKDDDWKTATVVDENAYLIYPLGEPEAQNTFYSQYAKAILQSAMIEYLDCMADERAYLISQVLLADDKSDFDPEQPDLKPMLLMLALQEE